MYDHAFLSVYLQPSHDHPSISGISQRSGREKDGLLCGSSRNCPRTRRVPRGHRRWHGSLPSDRRRPTASDRPSDRPTRLGRPTDRTAAACRNVGGPGGDEPIVGPTRGGPATLRPPTDPVPLAEGRSLATRSRKESRNASLPFKIRGGKIKPRGQSLAIPRRDGNGCPGVPRMQRSNPRPLPRRDHGDDLHQTRRG